MEASSTKVIKNFRIETFIDEDPISPRENDNMGTMVCFHSRYNLGDDNHNYNFRNYDSWEEMKSDIIRKENVAAILPLYLYDHSGITMKTTSFNDRWDSGQVGWIYISKAKAREEYGWKLITPKRKELIVARLISEVEEYDQYLCGDIYGFRITDTTNDEEVDSCWGYYGEDYCMEEAEGIVNSMIKSDEDKRKIQAE